MKHKTLLLLLAMLLPAFVAVGQGGVSEAGAQTGATAADGHTGATTNSAAAASARGAEDDTVVVSLLTCSPGEEIHRLYGHTALRLQNGEDDWAVNFGWFSFNTPNFVMKFILGLTDYSMAYQTMPIFITDLLRDDMGVTEQELNLTTAEAAYVKAALDHTLCSQNYDRHEYTFSNPTTGEAKTETVLAARWTYRYNYLYDNCTTRAVDIVREAVRACGEEVVFPSLSINRETTTQRTMIHEFTTQSPWFEFGQDVLLGPEVDREYTIRAVADSINFLPTYAQNFFQQAQIRDAQGRLRPLVGETRNLTPFLVPAEHRPAVPFTPLAVAGVVLGAALLITIFQRRAELQARQTADTLLAGGCTPAQRAWRIWGNAFDFTAWTLQSLVGMLLVVMVVWSEHPAVGTNWLLLIFNPLYLLGIPARLWWTKGEAAFAWFVCLMALATIIVGALGVQQFPVAVYPLAIAVALRAKPITRGRVK